MTEDRPPRRRDLLVTIAFGATGVGVTLAMWPFIAALQPPADNRALQVVFRLAELRANAPSLVAVGNNAIMVLRRAPDELTQLRAAKQTTRPVTDWTHPSGANNWHRSLRPEIAVMHALCTRGDCVVQRASTSEATLLCPCCGSRYDLAGRVVSGPTQRDLVIPPHDYIDEATIAFPYHAPT